MPQLLPTATAVRLLDNSDQFSVVMEYEQVVGPEESAVSSSSGSDEEESTHRYRTSSIDRANSHGCGTEFTQHSDSEESTSEEGISARSGSVRRAKRPRQESDDGTSEGSTRRASRSSRAAKRPRRSLRLRASGAETCVESLTREARGLKARRSMPNAGKGAKPVPGELKKEPRTLPSAGSQGSPGSGHTKAGRSVARYSCQEVKF